LKSLYLNRNVSTLILVALLFSAGCSPKETAPPYLSLLPHPSTTHHSLFSLRGRKNPGDNILINNQVIVVADGSTFWSGEVPLKEGNNPLLIKSVNEFGNESVPVGINTILDTAPPSPPGVTSPLLPLSSWSITVPLQGTKDSGSDILLNGKEIVSYTPYNVWSSSYSPLQGTTMLQFSSKNIVGNESSKTVMTINYNGPSAPRLTSPLDGEKFKNSLGTPNILFSWTNTLSLTYQIQIASIPDFSSSVVDVYNPGNPYSLSLSPFPPLSAGVYYWRVGAYDSLGNIFYSPSRKWIFGKVKGDFNGDGYADILVGAEKAGGPGQVRIFFGGPDPSGGKFTPSSTPNLTLQGENGGDLFGTSLAAGDLNGDGYDDIIVGAYSNGAGGERTGRVYIYFGGPGLHSTPDVILTGFFPGEQFGVSVASGEDINQDGYDDLLVGANLNSVKGTNAGRAYLFLGGKSISLYPDMVFNGEAPGDHFGISVAMAGDINGDGFSDFLIGAAGDGSSSHIGKAYLYYGEFEPGNQTQNIFSGSSFPGDGFGRMVAGVKDFNGDGYDDFLIGAPFHAGPNQEPQAGAAYLYLGGPNLGVIPNLTLRLPSNNAVASANFGFTAASVGDLRTLMINGVPRKDGYADFVIGAYAQITQSHTDSNGNLVVDAAAGMAHLFLGGASPSPNIYSSLFSGNNSQNELFSVSLSSPGDLNGDGFADLIVGAMMADQGKGRAYYYDGYLLSNPTLCSTCVLRGIFPLEGFGFAAY
jgi:hypothetical protein